MADDGSLTIKLDPRTAEQLAERARHEGVTPEEYAAELVAEGVAVGLDEPPPGFVESEEELRASLEEQLLQIETGEGELIPHAQVMAEMHAKIEAAKTRKA